MKKKTFFRIKRIGFMLFLLFVIGFLSAKAYHNTNEKKVYSMIMVPKAMDEENGFWSSLMEGAKLGASEYHVKLDFMGASDESDVKGQIRCLRAAIKKRPDAIIVAPGDAKKVTPAVSEAIHAGIKVVLVDSVLDKELGDGIVATDNLSAGKELGQYARRYLSKEDEIAIIGHVKAASTAKDRENGLRAGLGDYKENIKEVDYCGSSFAVAEKETEELLLKYPNLSMIVGTNEYSAVGAARVIDRQGLKDKITVLGFDNSLEEIKLLEKGVFEAIIIQKPVNMGYLGITQAVKALKNESQGEYIDSGFKLISRGNMYIDENQRLLYPFSD